MKDTANNILRQIGIKQEDMKNWKNLKVYDKLENNKVIEKGEPIFMRLKAEEEEEFLKNIMQGNANNPRVKPVDFHMGL